MHLQPKKSLTPQEVLKGLNVVIWDGLAAEIMTSFTGGTFLVAMALLLGANNIQIGILAALPLFTNIFQLLSIWLVSKFNNRRAVAVYCGILARLPLIFIGLLLLFLPFSSVNVLIFFLFFHYTFGAIAGPSWNSWMKDMVPENKLGEYFSRRSRYTQTLNVVLSILLGFTIDYMKEHLPGYELVAYALFFIVGGVIGLAGALILSKAPEPQSYLTNHNILSLFKLPLKNQNFCRLLAFNSVWVFALNIATPFFTVFMMKSMGLPLSVIVGLSVVSQLSSIFTLRMWGVFSDRYSNKSIIAVSAPLYILCIIAWCFVGIYTRFYANLLLLFGIHVFSGISTAGINLALTNIGLKLAPKKEAIVFLSVKNMITAVFSSLGPLAGGLLADFFSSRKLSVILQWTSPSATKIVRLIALHEWNFLFLIGALIALISLQLLTRIKETGEVSKDVVRRIMRTSIKSNLKEYFLIGNLISLHQQLVAIIKPKKRPHH